MVPGNIRPAQSDDLQERTTELPLDIQSFSNGLRERTGPVDCYAAAGLDGSAGLVGFAQQFVQTDAGDCLVWQAFETRATADIQSLQDIGAKFIFIRLARLRYEETPAIRANPWDDKSHCVGDVGFVSGVDTSSGEPVESIPGAGVRHDDTDWDVTGVVRGWLLDPTTNNGLLLSGLLEEGQYGDGSKACLSSVSKLFIDVTFLGEPELAETDLLSSDLVAAATRTSTPGPVERIEQDADKNVLIYRSPTPSPATTVGTSSGSAPDPGFVSKARNDAQIVRAVTPTATRTPEPMVVPKPRSPFVQ
jgi:hypothetical protein